MAGKLSPETKKKLKDPRYIVALRAVKPLQKQKASQNSKKKSTK
jgi:hypothetical protein